MTRTSDRFDVIQMSLVDTWAATGAGAFTLSENGLYTREAWRIFLDRLTPDRRAERVALVLAAARLGNEPADGAGRRRAARARHGPAARPPGAGRASQRGHAARVGVAAVRGRPAHPGSDQPGARLHCPRLAAAAPVRPAAERDRAEPIDGGAGGGHRRRPLRLSAAHRRAAVLLQHGAPSGLVARQHRDRRRRHRRQPARDQHLDRHPRRLAGLRGGDHRRSAGRARPAGVAGAPADRRPGLLRRDRHRLHAGAGGLPAALLGAARPPDLRTGRRPLLDDPLRRTGQLRVGVAARTGRPAFRHVRGRRSGSAWSPPA